MSSRKVKLNLERQTPTGTVKPNPRLCFYVNKAAAPFIRALVNYQEMDRRSPSPYYSVTIDVPYKPRTTGKKSQNNHVWGDATQIGNELGWTAEDVVKYAKQQAIRRGYPPMLDENGDIKLDPWDNPYGESMKDLSTVEIGHLIDELHQIAAENSIILIEGEYE